MVVPVSSEKAVATQKYENKVSGKLLSPSKNRVTLRHGSISEAIFTYSNPKDHN
jgi:hypothetical protein